MVKTYKPLDSKIYPIILNIVGYNKFKTSRNPILNIISLLLSSGINCYVMALIFTIKHHSVISTSIKKIFLRIDSLIGFS